MFEHPRLRAVVCNSSMVRDEIAAGFKLATDKLNVIYNGVDNAWFHPGLADQHRARVRGELSIPADAPLYLLVGSGFERKGVPALLEALLQIQGAYALIIGADKHLTRYRAAATPRALFLGGQSDVRPYYGAADVFVLPTLYDPQPNAALEALACGLPVVTSSKCGAAELIAEGVSGYVRDALDIDGIAQAMREAADPARNPGMRRAARAVAEPLTLDAMAAKLLALYASLA
jgi:UDP-glucose:(heptosyl)LPS alpha-1,3-glucosyltransferase